LGTTGFDGLVHLQDASQLWSKLLKRLNNNCQQRRQVTWFHRFRWLQLFRWRLRFCL